MTTCRLLVGDALEVLRTLPDASVHCCVTSPLLSLTTRSSARLRIVPPRQQLPGCCYCTPVDGVTEYGWPVTRFVRCGASIGTAPCPRCDGTLCLAHVAAHRKFCGGYS